MLSLFNRFLSRMRSAHPILGNRNLLVIILDYLDGEDLFQIIQVSFSLRTTVQSVPNLEITLLRFTMKQSNECIDRLRTSATPAQRSPGLPYKALSHMPFIAMNKRVRGTPAAAQEKKEPDQPDFNDKKWVGFVDYFNHYAKQKGFSLLKRRDFENEEEWMQYKGKFDEFYGSYVNHIRNVRTKPAAPREPPRTLFRNYSTLLNRINFHMRDAFFPKKKEQECVQRKRPSAIEFI